MSVRESAYHRPRSPRPAWRDFFDALLVAILLAMFTRTWVVQAYRVPSSSMSPTLLAGDHIVVNKFVYRQPSTPLLPARSVRRGDVAVFRLREDAERVVVKRAVAVGGDRVLLVDKTLAVNDQVLDEPYVEHVDPFVYPSSRFLDPPLRHRDNLGPLEVPASQLFWLGDNRDQAQDSRLFGPTPRSTVIGHAVWVAWSRGPVATDLDRGTWLQRSRLGRGLRRALGFLRSFRGERFVRQIR